MSLLGGLVVIIAMVQCYSIPSCFSMMGAVLAVCLAMVLGASFFAYKNLYYAVMRKWYPDSYADTYPHGATK